MLVCVLLIAAGVAQAQTEHEKKKDALELKVSAPVTMICEGTSIDLELEIKNISQEVLKIDKADLWSQFFYSKSFLDGSGRGGGQASSCSHCRGDFIVLYAGDTFWTSHKFSLDGEFFRKAGKYDIGVTINSVWSNKIEFELIDCGKN